MQKKKKSKKQRTINNAIVSVDDIKIEPGDDFCDWIPRIRIKLKEREMIIIQKRVDICKDIITSSLTQFFKQNMQYFRNDKTVRVERMDRDNFLMYNKYIDSIQITKIMEECQEEIINELINWEGISCRVNTRKSEDITIRSYFSKCRSWWDQKKKNILAIYFWNVIINLIESFTKEAAAQFFSDRFVNLQNQYHKYLYLLILHNVFNGNIKLPNTANKYLISASICCKFIQQKVSFIKDLDINNHQNVLSEIQNTRKRIRCNKIRDIIVESIRYNYNLHKLRFQESLSNLHNEFKYYGTSNSSKPQENAPSDTTNNAQISILSSIAPIMYDKQNEPQQNCCPERNNKHNWYKLCFQETLSNLHNEFKHYGTKNSNQRQENSDSGCNIDKTNNAQISVSSSIPPPISPYIAQNIAFCPNGNGYIPFRNNYDYKRNVQNVRYNPY